MGYSTTLIFFKNKTKKVIKWKADLSAQLWDAGKKWEPETYKTSTERSEDNKG